MKVTFILFVSFILLEGCTTSKRTTGNKKMQIAEAVYEQWTEPPRAGTEIPEVGTDLTITVQNWPQGYTPRYIVYKGRKSFPATFRNRIDNKAIITARIIRSSSLINEESERVTVSDRLVFMTAEDETGFIEIDNWQRAED